MLINSWKSFPRTYCNNLKGRKRKSLLRSAAGKEINFKVKLPFLIQMQSQIDDQTTIINRKFFEFYINNQQNPIVTRNFLFRTKGFTFKHYLNVNKVLHISSSFNERDSNIQCMRQISRLINAVPYYVRVRPLTCPFSKTRSRMQPVTPNDRNLGR